MYTRVFTSILDSSINCSDIPPSARWLWLTMLLIGDEDRTGVVDMPVERLAARAGLSVEDTRAGLDLLMAPDPSSRTEDNEGRRIAPIRENGRGWEILNWSKYREIAQAEHNREQTRLRVQKHRAKFKSNGEDTPGNGDVTESSKMFASEAKAEAKAKTRAPAPKAQFEPPGASEVAAYFIDKGLSGEDSVRQAAAYVAHYRSVGWKVGRNHMRDWKAAAAGWLFRRDEYR